MESFSKEIPCKILCGLGPLILLKSNFPGFSTFRALKIGVKKLLQGLLAVSLKMKSQLLYSLKILTKKNRDIFVGHPVL